MKRPILLLVAFFLLPCFSALPQGEGSGAEILKRSSHVQVKGSKLITTDSIDIVILDRRGERYTNVSLPYTKGDKFRFGHANIRTMAGNTVRELKKKDIRERNYLDYTSLYSDVLEKYFSLRHNVYPYILSFSYSLTTDKYIGAVHAEPSGAVPVRMGRAVLETPPGYEILYTQTGMEPPLIDRTPELTRYRWEYTSPRVRDELSSPARPSELPRLTAVPQTFRYGVEGSWDSWESFGDWIYRLNEGMGVLPSWETARIDNILSGADGTEEKVRRLYRYLQDNHRYINVKIDIGGLKSYPADYVCVNRFGDCKALSNYFRAVLDYAGIESHYTLVNLDRQVASFDESFPFQVFNHVIVTVPTDDGRLFVECTSSNNPFGYIGTSLQGRRALVTLPSGSHLIDVPALSPEDVACVYRYDLKLGDGRSAAVSFDAELRGEEFERLVFIDNALSADKAEIYMRNFMVGGSFTMDGYRIERAGRDSPVANIIIDGTIGNFWNKYGGNVVINGLGMGLPVYESPAERTQPVQIDYPVDKTLIAVYDLSAADEGPVRIPGGMEVESRFGSYSVSYLAEGPTVTVTKTLTILPGTIPLYDYEEWHSFITQVRNHDNTNLVIEIP